MGLQVRPDEVTLDKFGRNVDGSFDVVGLDRHFTEQ